MHHSTLLPGHNNWKKTAFLINGKDSITEKQVSAPYCALGSVRVNKNEAKKWGAVKGNLSNVGSVS